MSIRRQGSGAGGGDVDAGIECGKHGRALSEDNQMEGRVLECS